MDSRSAHGASRGCLIAGLNPVCTDAGRRRGMGYNPRAARGTAPFQTCDNTLLLAEGHGVGAADLKPHRGTGRPHRAGLIPLR